MLRMRRQGLPEWHRVMVVPSSSISTIFVFVVGMRVGLDRCDEAATEPYPLGTEGDRGEQAAAVCDSSGGQDRDPNRNR